MLFLKERDSLITEDLELVKSYYGYNTEKALDALRLLSKDQIEYIKKKLNVGGN
jgi:hypothetical protein